jgi:hypothetical protein
MRASARVLTFAFLLAGLCLSAALASDERPEPAAGAEESPYVRADGEETVFRSVREEAADGRILWSDVFGDLDPDTAVRVARPWSYLDEDVTYREEAFSRSVGGGVVRYGYRIVRVPNRSPVRPQLVWGPPEIGPALKRELAAGDPAAVLPLGIDVRGMPEWDVPPRPVAFALPATALSRAEAERRAAIEARRELADRLMDPVVDLIERLGGEVVSRGELSGWLTARVPASSVAVLATRADLRRLSLLRGRVEPSAQWNLQDVRSDSYVDARQFLDAGFTGETANPDRHAFGDITIGVIEPDQLEDDACFLFDGADCSGESRLQELFRCDDIDRDGNYCEPVGFFRDNDKSASHGTLVASVALGDYTGNQGDPYALGDDNWTPGGGHSDAWEQERTGLAREARLIFFGQMADNDGDDGTSTSSAFADAFDDAIDRAVDITNNSWSWTSDGASDCSLEAISPHEQEAENAFDDGILMVVAAANPNDPICQGNRAKTCSVNADCDAGEGPCVAASSRCNLDSPADLPKTFAVNGLNGAESSCQLAYSNCLTDPDYSANGGVDGTVNGSTCTGCISGVSITAPTRICATTGAGGLWGNPNLCFTGTSASSPVVAGAAALVKDQYLSNGQTFINSPGRLHAVMLAMGDRNTHVWGDGSTSQQIIGTSDLMGTGRLKMRLLANGSNMDPWGNNLTTASFTTGTPDLGYAPWSTPLPTGAALVKCVLYQVEDMSAKSDISRIDLELRLRDPVSGQCEDPLGAVTFTRINSGTEIKKMAAIADDEVTLGGRCVHVTLDSEHVTSQGVTGIASCYYAGVHDEVSAPN